MLLPMIPFLRQRAWGVAAYCARPRKRSQESQATLVLEPPPQQLPGRSLKQLAKGPRNALVPPPPPPPQPRTLSRLAAAPSPPPSRISGEALKTQTATTRGSKTEDKKKTPPSVAGMPLASLPCLPPPRVRVSASPLSPHPTLSSTPPIRSPYTLQVC
eukprot:COSAG02_NODE_336_length_24344_cov_63.239101_12_plen_158_part_00